MILVERYNSHINKMINLIAEHLYAKAKNNHEKSFPIRKDKSSGTVELVD